MTSRILSPLVLGLLLIFLIGPIEQVIWPSELRNSPVSS